MFSSLLFKRFSLNSIPNPSLIYKKSFRINSKRCFSTTISDFNHFDYDLICIGSGSGGLACSREAASLGKRVAVLDIVHPSPQGSKWGIGGTCTNVGCIPKKLMHHAGMLRDEIKDSEQFGWKIPHVIDHDWNQLVETVQNYIRGNNWSYKMALRDENIDYIPAEGSLLSNHKVQCTFSSGDTKTITSRHIVLSVGGRPYYPDIEGAIEHCITSDDIFSLDKSPGKTLLIGGSYIALETAGFLTQLNFQTSVMYRSRLLRGFDEEMALRIQQFMSRNGTQFFKKCRPLSIIRLNSNELQVSFEDIQTKEIKKEIFNTVMMATGRKPNTERLGLENVGIEIHKSSGKIICSEYDETNIPNIYAIGDVVEGKLELSPVAIQSGKLLAQRLFNGQIEIMDPKLIPTTIFTPLEYGLVGLNEEDAIKQYGQENIEVYHCAYEPLERRVIDRFDENGNVESPSCYIKLICSKQENLRILGLHLCGFNAGEIVQGFSVALRLGATIKDFHQTIGIHPTQAEEIVQLQVTKDSGLPFEKTSC